MTLIIVTSSFSGVALAEENDALIVKDAKISLKQSVDIALKQVTGIPAQSEIEYNDKGILIWEVEIINAKQQIIEIEVDAITGKILNKKIDKADNDHEK